ncbi:TetR family transcriptional regulator [Methylocapsa aurea]|uniref:TetR/AcrR family transcriptional regulator n=1 Tax=Methylocapsa aurea TaxID=663610 RepID=UPI00055E1938
MITINDKSEHIVAASTLLFAERGYLKTSMDEVAMNCFIDISTLYNLYPNRETLAMAAMTMAMSYIEESVLHYAYNNEIDTRDRLIYMNASAECLFSSERRSYLFLTLVVERLHIVAPFTIPIQNYFDSWRNAYRAIFVASHITDEARSLACDFVSDLQGALIMMRVTGSVEPMRRLSARLLQLYDRTIRCQRREFRSVDEGEDF